MNISTNFFNLETKNNKILSAQLGNNTYSLHGRIYKNNPRNGFSTCRPIRYFFIKHAKLTIDNKSVIVRISHLKKMLGCDTQEVKKILKDHKGNLNNLFCEDKQLQEFVREHLKTLSNVAITTTNNDILFKKENGKIRIYKKTSPDPIASGSFKEIYSYNKVNGISNKKMAYAFTKESEISARVYEDTIVEYELGKHFYESYSARNPNRIPPFVKYYTLLTPEENKAGIMMESCHKDLSDELNSLTPAQKAKIFMDILNGIEHMHQENYLHKDIKFENFLIKYDEQQNPSAKVIDFGFTIPSDDEESLASELTGSYPYFAPESFLDNPKFEIEESKKIDSWALGIVLYVMHYNQFPDFRAMLDVIFDESIPEEERLIITPEDRDLIIDEMQKIAELQHSDDIINVAISGLLNVDPKKRWSVEQVRVFLSDYNGQLEIGA